MSEFEMTENGYTSNLNRAIHTQTRYLELWISVFIEKSYIVEFMIINLAQILIIYFEHFCQTNVSCIV